MTGAIAYMYDCISTSERADPSKIVPGWGAVYTDHVVAKRNEVCDGVTTAIAAAAEMKDKATAALGEYWAQFDTDLQTFLNGFTPVHSQ